MNRRGAAVHHRELYISTQTLPKMGRGRDCGSSRSLPMLLACSSIQLQVLWCILGLAIDDQMTDSRSTYNEPRDVTISSS